MKCRVCNREPKDATEFCPFCGAPLRFGVEPIAVKSEKTPPVTIRRPGKAKIPVVEKTPAEGKKEAAGRVSGEKTVLSIYLREIPPWERLAMLLHDWVDEWIKEVFRNPLK